MDNFIAIVKDNDGKFRGYDCSASQDYFNVSDYKKGFMVFEVDTMEHAVSEAQKNFTEYGYSFVNMFEKKPEKMIPVMTVRELKRFIAEHRIPDDAEIYYQRIEDKYFDEHSWETKNKPSEDGFIDQFIGTFGATRYPNDMNLYITAHY